MKIKENIEIDLPFNSFELFDSIPTGRVQIKNLSEEQATALHNIRVYLQNFFLINFHRKTSLKGISKSKNSYNFMLQCTYNPCNFSWRISIKNKKLSVFRTYIRCNHVF